MVEIPANLDPCNLQSLPPNQPVITMVPLSYDCVFVVVIIYTQLIFIKFLYSRCTTTFVHVCVMAPTGSAFSIKSLEVAPRC